MASYVKFDCFVEDLVRGVHDFGGDDFRVFLTISAPYVTNAVRVDLLEGGPADGNGYATGGKSVAISVVRAGGTVSIVAADPEEWRASGGTIGPFRYAVLYNDTPPADPLVAVWDYESSITLQPGEAFAVDFGESLFTLT